MGRRPFIWSKATANSSGTEGVVGLARTQPCRVRLPRSLLVPPAERSPIVQLVVVVNNMSWGFLVAPVAIGAWLLAAWAFIWHNLFRRGSWPVRWR
jgi:hypothetical protein